MRRQLPNDLAAAEEHFQAALALDPAQPTANRRLGQIALAPGELRGGAEPFERRPCRTAERARARQPFGELEGIAG